MLTYSSPRNAALCCSIASSCLDRPCNANNCSQSESRRTRSYGRGGYSHWRLWRLTEGYIWWRKKTCQHCLHSGRSPFRHCSGRANERSGCIHRKPPFECASPITYHEQAYEILLTLSELAKRNRTIILSLHQPRSDAYSLFTRLLLLSKGSVVYSGLTSKCLPWFKTLGFRPDVGVNPLDFLIDISSVEMGDEAKRDASRAQVERLVKTWKEDGKAYSADKSARWSRRISREPLATPSKDLAAHGTAALRAFFNADEGDAALRRPGLISQTISLTSR